MRSVGHEDDGSYPMLLEQTAGLGTRLHPLTTGAVQILLDQPGPRVDPPLRVQVEYGPDAIDLEALQRRVEDELRAKLIVRAEVELMPPETLPRFEMKAQLIRRLYEEAPARAR